MLLVSEANFFSKKNRVLINSVCKTAAEIVLDFWWGGFGCGGWDAATESRW